jgi:hypothetical protein
VLGQLYLNRLESEVSGGTKVAILIAAADVPIGATLTEARLAVRGIPPAFRGRDASVACLAAAIA